MEKIECVEGLVNMSQILEKVQAMNTCCDEMSACCDTLSQGDVIRSIMTTDSTGKNRVFMTDDGSTPVEVPFIFGDPIETWLNTDLMRTIFFNRTDIFEVYLNGDVVFRKALELTLPQYTTEINLRSFIDGKNTEGYTVVIVTNNLIQPKLRSGNMFGLEVTLKNYGEFQGISSSGDAMLFTSTMKFLNYGWAKGAGGSGGAGSGANASSGSGGLWTVRHHTAPTCTPNGVITPRYWNEGANMEWRPKTTTNQCASTTKGPYTTNGPYDHRSGSYGWYCITSWGDQGKVVFLAEAHQGDVATWRWRNGQSDGGALGSISYQGYGSYSISGGVKGVAGAGQGFRVAQDAGWKAARDATFSGDYGVFNLSTGNTIVASSADLKGWDGGHGGAWATAGGDGENGASGQPGGRAIVGFSYLTLDSDIGDTIGAVV